MVFLCQRSIADDRFDMAFQLLVAFEISAIRLC